MSFTDREAECKAPQPSLLLSLIGYIDGIKTEPTRGLASPTPAGFNFEETNIALNWCINHRLLATDRLAGLSDKGIGYLAGLLASAD